MKFSGTHLKRYKQIVTILWKYGRTDMVQQMSAQEDFDPQDLKPNEKDAAPEQLADDLEAMGPTYVKIGQVLAGRSDLLPEPYRVALARLQDKVKPFPYEEVESIILAELGIRISKAFSRFDITPIAAASLGQVHRAALRDGREVVVKVQRPNIRGQIAEDFDVLSEIAHFMDNHTDAGKRYRFTSVLNEFKTAIQQELNYELEAQNLITVGHNLRDFPLILVPQPVIDYSTRSVLTMDFVSGKKITSLGPLGQLDINGAPLAEELFRAYLKQILLDGIFHADPHPGNVFVTDDGRIALLDLGMVGHTAPKMQEHLLKVLLAVSDGKGDEAADIVVKMSEKTEAFDLHAFKHQIGQLVAIRANQGLKDLNVGRSLMDVSRYARENGLIVPSELTLLGKTLLELDDVGRILDPSFDPNASIRRNAGELTAQRLGRESTQGSVVNALLEMKDFTVNLPSRLNRIMDAVANAELEVKVRVPESKMVVEGIEKVANRITNGILLASLIIGAALLMRVDTPWHIFGYPAFAMVCFMFAAVGACILLYTIAAQDRASRKSRHR
ncbi:MAG TPA: AarF/UbiB family protein [Opitutaceae bacterium]|jgi:predicted unusual protein kinase regulating ubiquinone biosynthesis (AarF/ABC1/UbiB family)|nr:AarF/UbiB family protein [Opitutaceae bacterium]